MSPNDPDSPAPARPVRRRRGRGIRPGLIALKHVGLFLHLGGLAALAAMGGFAPAPETAAGWIVLKGVMKAVFWPCVFGGLVLAILAGVALWLQHPRVFLGQRWFRVKAAALAVVVPSLHFVARPRVQAFYASIEAGDLDALPAAWRGVTITFAAAFVVMTAIAVIGRTKPRWGQPVPLPARPPKGRGERGVEPAASSSA